MTPNYGSVFVLCPAGPASGGPDALHRLVHALNEAGARAAISYVPFDGQLEVPEIYRRYYRTPVAAPVDAPGNLVVLPEVMTGYARQIRHARTAIWWLSVAHFYGYAGQGDHVFRRLRLLHDARSLLGVPIPQLRWSEMRRVDHYSPSAHAADFLRRHGIASQPLRDPINDIFFTVRPAARRRDAVAYNPVKGMQFTAKIVAAMPEVEWIAVQGMSHEQVAEVFCTTKAFVDFGFFPGRERMPREAALCGCCLVTGRRGAAAVAEDLAIPDRYRINHRARDFANQARDAVLDIFANFEMRSRDFDSFRDEVRKGPSMFLRDIRAIFFSRA
jgi:hypothetical protein